MQTRRTFLRCAVLLPALGLPGLGLLAGCARRIPDGTTGDVIGDDRAPGDPVWTDQPRSWIVAYDAPALARARRSYPAALAATVADGIAALAPACPVEGTEVGYCVSARCFVCPSCASAFDRWGHAIDGPAVRGLARRPVQVVDGSLVVQGGTTVPGPDVALTRPDGTSGRMAGAADGCTGRLTLPPPAGSVSA